MPRALHWLRNATADPRIVLPLILVWVIYLTAPNVFGNELWNDELRTWRDGIEKPLSAVLTWQHNPDHAPLGHLLARTGAAIFGVEHPWALRLGNFLCGLLCVPALWWMGRTLSSNAAGLIAASFFAVDPNCMFQMTQARMYSVMLLAGIVSITLAGSILIRPEKPWRRVMLLGVAMAAGIWGHSQTYAIVISLILLAVGLLIARERRIARAIAIAILIGGALASQGVAKMISRHDAEKIEAEDHQPAIDQLTDAIHHLGGEEWITYVLIGSTIGGAMMIHHRGDRRLAALIVLIVIVSIVNLAIAARYRPVAHARYLTILQPAMWLAMSTCLVAICRSKHRWTLGVAAVALTISLSIYELGRVRENTVTSTRSIEFAQAARLVRSQMQPGDRIVFVPRMPYTMFARYYGLNADGAIDSALGERQSVRKQRSMLRDAELDRGTIWIIGLITPPRHQDPDKDTMSGIHASDDAVKVAERILEARGIDTKSVSRVHGVKETKRLLLLKIDQSSVTEIKVPAQLEAKQDSEPVE